MMQGNTHLDGSSKSINKLEFFVQIFVSVEGPNIFILPTLFKDVGCFVGIVASLIVGFVYANAMHSYVKCADVISRKKNTSKQSLYLLPQFVFEEISYPRVGHYLRIYLKYEIIVSGCFGLSLQWQCVMESLKLIFKYFDYTPTDNLVLLYLLIPMVLISWIPSFKYIAFLSYFVIVCIGLVTCVIVYYLLRYPRNHTNPEIFKAVDLPRVVTFMSSIFIIISFTPLLFPLKNEMKNGHTLSHFFGPLTSTVAVIIVLNCCISLLVYVQIGNNVSENLFDNLPQNEILLVTNCIFTLASILCVSPTLYVIIFTIWDNEMASYLSKFGNALMYEYVVKTCVGLFIILVVAAVPSFIALINLITCFSFPFDSIMLPAILESVVTWKNNEHDFQFKLLMMKNIAIGVFCLIISGTSLVNCIRDFF